jgi:hypothetical protein
MFVRAGDDHISLPEETPPGRSSMVNATSSPPWPPSLRFVSSVATSSDAQPPALTTPLQGNSSEDDDDPGTAAGKHTTVLHSTSNKSSPWFPESLNSHVSPTNVSDAEPTARSQSGNRPFVNQDVISDIHDLIEYGSRHHQMIAWKTTSPKSVGRMLSRFRPDEWLNDDAVMETLYRMTSDRPDVHVVECHDFSAAYLGNIPGRIRRWTSPTIVVIPVHQEHPQHWFLVSLHFVRKRVVVHSRPTEDCQRVAEFVLAADLGLEGWLVEYRTVRGLSSISLCGY